jgi:hypothetical protein
VPSRPGAELGGVVAADSSKPKKIRVEPPATSSSGPGAGKGGGVNSLGAFWAAGAGPDGTGIGGWGGFCGRDDTDPAASGIGFSEPKKIRVKSPAACWVAGGGPEGVVTGAAARGATFAGPVKSGDFAVGGAGENAPVNSPGFSVPLSGCTGVGGVDSAFRETAPASASEGILEGSGELKNIRVNSLCSSVAVEGGEGATGGCHVLGGPASGNRSGRTVDSLGRAKLLGSREA